MKNSLKSSFGLAQIPLMIVLLLMAIAVPVATKLVQENADSRNMASGGTLCVSLRCGSRTKYISEYRKRGGDLCKCGTALTAKPTAKPTVKPGTNRSKGGKVTVINTFGCGKKGVVSNYKKYCGKPITFNCASNEFSELVGKRNNCSARCTYRSNCGPASTAKPTIVRNPTAPTSGVMGGGAKCNTGNGWSGTCTTNDKCDNEWKSGVEFDIGGCGKGLGCCGVQPGSVAPTKPTGISTKAPTKPVAIPTGGAATRCYCKPSCNINSQCYYSDLPMPYAVSCLVTFCKTVNPTVVPTSPYTGGSSATPTKKPSGGGDDGGNNKCVQVCREGVGQLSNCTPPEADGTAAVSICNIAGRLETCGGSQFCCPVAEGKWTLDMTKCPDITPTVSPGQDSVLNYKIAFGGVNPNSAQCVVNWPLQFIVLGGGESMVYTDIVPEIKTVVGNRLVFSGSLVLTGFSKTSDVAVFISGPKHLQVKYGKNNQSDAYNQAGGELVLTADVSTSPVYDFSNYPIIPGDVVGVNSDFSDGWINGVDFAYVKTKSLVHETVAEGGYLKGDLDGNCQVNSNDVNLLKISLQDKQGQLY